MSPWTVSVLRSQEVHRTRCWLLIFDFKKWPFQTLLWIFLAKARLFSHVSYVYKRKKLLSQVSKNMVAFSVLKEPSALPMAESIACMFSSSRSSPWDWASAPASCSIHARFRFVSIGIYTAFLSSKQWCCYDDSCSSWLLLWGTDTWRPVFAPPRLALAVQCTRLLILWWRSLPAVENGALESIINIASFG